MQAARLAVVSHLLVLVDAQLAHRKCELVFSRLALIVTALLMSLFAGDRRQGMRGT